MRPELREPSASADRTVRRLIALTAFAGALLSVQARINGTLARELGSSVVTALVSFSVGTVALVVLVLASGRWARARRARAGVRLRWWWCGGGFGGAFLVATSALAVPQTGVALLGVGTVAGQTVGSLVVDEVGLSPRGRQPITIYRALGAALAVVALAIGAGGDRRDIRLGLFVLIALAGAGVAAQQAANGHLQRITGEPLVAALVSFTVGTVGLAVVAAVLAVTGQVGTVTWPDELGHYLGGLCGAVYITLAAAAVGRLGVLRLTLASVAGQLFGALLLDLYRPAAGDGLRSGTIVATAVTFLAVAVSGRRVKDSR
ncbi:MAG TPA: DMT family transporter [Mycobacteriales bacterium]|nr:DMT family transporter [Mycobacteriales bacterium]